MSSAETKNFRAIHRWARIAPRKARLIADMVRGMPVNDAVAILERHPKRAAHFFKKVVKSALANASQDLDVDLNTLVVSESRVDEGPLLGGRARWRPRAQGRATPIRKRTSHLHIVLSEADAGSRRASRSAAAESVPVPAAPVEENTPAEKAEASE
ncbi:MAG: 50S ribosomal protein L22 [Planctomycetota bacterium]